VVRQALRVSVVVISSSRATRVKEICSILEAADWFHKAEAPVGDAEERFSCEQKMLPHFRVFLFRR